MSSVPGKSLRHFVEHELGKFPHFVIYAVLEWTLIALLFLDGFLAFLSTEFAEFFDLMAPCVLCTRIDHMLARKKVRCCYNDSICEEHKKELSSLAYCHVHAKLSDLRTMCEGCLLSFGTDNRSDPESYKSMSGALHTDIDGVFDEEMGNNGKDDHHIMIQGDPKNASGMLCSCCGEPMKVKSSGYQNNNSNSNSNNNIISNPKITTRVASRLSQQGPTPSPRAPFGNWRTEETRSLDMAKFQAKMSSKNLTEEEDIGTLVEPAGVKEGTKPTPLPLSTEPEELMVEEIVRTPSFIKGNRLLGIHLPDSAAASPRWASRSGGDSVTASPRWASRLGDSAVASPKWAHRGSKKSLLDRVELAPDPVDQIIGDDTDTDTETILIRLKKQVRQDSKSLINLYMELDEERSASAVAANNAMAMITRVQAEKASVQMESLQYQRMMEEQAEYDQEALEMLREMLNKREDEVRELEIELDIYKERYGIITDDIRGHRLQRSLSFSSFTEKSDHDHESPIHSMHANDNEMEQMSDRLSNHNTNSEDSDETMMGIERERSYLFGQLRMLESRILHSAADSVANSPTNGEQTGEEKDNVLAKEVSELGEKLRSLKEDSRFLKNAIRTLKKDRTEGSKVLIEIAQNLQKLRHVDNSTSQAAAVAVES